MSSVGDQVAHETALAKELAVVTTTQQRWLCQEARGQEACGYKVGAIVSDQNTPRKVPATPRAERKKWLCREARGWEAYGCKVGISVGEENAFNRVLATVRTERQKRRAQEARKLEASRPKVGRHTPGPQELNDDQEASGNLALALPTLADSLMRALMGADPRAQEQFQLASRGPTLLIGTVDDWHGQLKTIDVNGFSEAALMDPRTPQKLIDDIIIRTGGLANITTAPEFGILVVKAHAWELVTGAIFEAVMRAASRTKQQGHIDTASLMRKEFEKDVKDYGSFNCGVDDVKEVCHELSGALFNLAVYFSVDLDNKTRNTLLTVGGRDRLAADIKTWLIRGATVVAEVRQLLHKQVIDHWGHVVERSLEQYVKLFVKIKRFAPRHDLICPECDHVLDYVGNYCRFCGCERLGTIMEKADRALAKF